MIRSIRAVLCLVGVIALTGVLAGPHLLFIMTRLPYWKTTATIWHRVTLRLLSLKVDVIGKRYDDGPVMFAANHVSWLDIVVLGATLRGSFIAKSEVKTWPGISLLANLQRTVYVSRDRKTAKAESDTMQARLEKGDNLILFPEGTSNDGLRIQDFRSAFFVLAERDVQGEPLKVQPVSVTYTHVDGYPVTRKSMPKVSWYGDMELAPHLVTYMLGGPYRVQVRFFDPVTVAELGNRKKLAVHCRKQIVTGNSLALSGTRPTAPVLTDQTSSA